MATTRKIDGQHLSVDCFAYAPDPADARTWRCVIRFPSDPRRQINHIKNSSFRFAETKGIPTEDRYRVWQRIAGACVANGIAVNEQDAPPQHSEHALADLLSDRFLKGLGY